MPSYIEMPKLSDTMTEGKLLKWLVSEGDKIELGAALAEVETDKATMEMEAFDDGILHKIYVQAGQSVPLGTALGLLLAEGEEPPENADTPPAAPAAEEKKESRQDVETGKPESESDQPRFRRTRPSESDRLIASPLARKIAAERGVDLESIEGTGPGGRIVKDDVIAAARAPKTAPGVVAAAAPAIRPVMGENDTRVELSGMRKIIAERLFASKTQIPHFYLTIEVDAAPLMELRAQVNAAAEANGGNKFTLNDFILKAIVSSAVAVPDVNASYDGDSIVKFAAVNLAVAVAIDDGLVTPVIRDAQNKTLLEISEAVKDVASRARSKKLSPDEFQGGTITVSSLGAYGIDSFDAIINPPQAAILSIGAITKKPVISPKGEVVPGQRMSVGMSCDHRVIDGAVGATYLAEFRKLIENPALMLV